jgi:hypothetical protein
MYITDKREVEFYSLQECARFFGKNGGHISYYIKRAVPVYTEHGWTLFKYAEDPWPEFDAEQVMKGRRFTYRAIKARNLKTGEERTFIGAEEAKKAIGIGRATLDASLKRGTPTRSGWSFECVNDDEVLNKAVSEKLSTVLTSWKRTPRKPKKVLLTNTETGEVSEYASAEELAKEWGVSKNTLQCRFAKHGYKWQKWKIQYLD